MDFIRMNCPMAVLTEERKHQMKASFPLLLPFLQSPFGSHPNEIENRLRQENLKNTSVPIYYG